MKYSRLTPDARLVFSQQAISIVKRDHTLRTLLVRYGIDDAELNDGLARQKRAQHITSKRIMDFGMGIVYTQVFRDALKRARTTYGKLRSIVRVAVDKEDKGIFTQLRMDQPISKQIEGFIAQANHFYVEALDMPELLEVVARFNITPEVLKEGLAELHTVETARMYQKKQKGAAKVTRTERDAAMAELDQWMKKFLAIARIAASSEPQQLEKIGLVVR